MKTQPLVFDVSDECLVCKKTRLVCRTGICEICLTTLRTDIQLWKIENHSR